MTEGDAIITAQSLVAQMRATNLRDEDRFQGAVLTLAGQLRAAYARGAASDPNPPCSSWVLFHRLWTKAVDTADYDKAEWTAMEAALLEAGIKPRRPAEPARVKCEACGGTGFVHEACCRRCGGSMSTPAKPR